MKKEKDTVIVQSDWLEFKELRPLNGEFFVNLRRSDISEVLDDINVCDKFKGYCTIVMKNGTVHKVNMPYEKVMELV